MGSALELFTISTENSLKAHPQIELLDVIDLANAKIENMTGFRRPDEIEPFRQLRNTAQKALYQGTFLGKISYKEEDPSVAQ